MCLFVRNIRMPEGRTFQRLGRRDANRIKMRRAQANLISEQRSKDPEIARRFYGWAAQVCTFPLVFSCPRSDPSSLTRGCPTPFMSCPLQSPAVRESSDAG